MSFHAASKTTDLTPGAMKSVSVGGKNILLANIDGAFYAMQQKCPHMGANLCRGKLVENTVTCPIHAATFDVTSGEVIKGAHLLFLKFKTKAAATYRVKIEGDTVLIDA